MHHGPSHVARHGEADPHVVAAGRQDGWVDADRFAVEIHERAAGVAGIDRGIGLNEILVPLDAEPRAAERADDPGCHRLAEAEWIADRHHEVADLKLIRIAEIEGDQSGGFHLQQRNVGAGVAADELGRELAAVREIDRDLVRVFHHMVIRQDVAVARIDDDARPRALLRNRLFSSG